MMFTLRVAPDWAEQIRKIRDAVTEDTNLIRFDNGFYRVCRAGDAMFQIRVLPGVDGARGVELQLRERDLYVMRIDGRPFETYAATLDQRRLQAPTLDDALIKLPRAAGAELFEAQSLVVLCVAESLRNDHIATRIGQLVRKVTTGLVGAPVHLPVSELLTEVRVWGQASEAVFAALSSTARGIALKRRVELTPLQRHFSERVDLARVSAALQPWARAVKVLKRPK